MITVDNIKKQITKNKNLFIFLRHGEKAPNSIQDKNPILLSERGEQDSITLGAELKSLNIPIRIFSSPEFRCIQTAKLIRKNNFENNIFLSRILGAPGIQIRNVEAYNTIYETKKCRDIYNDWKKGNYYDILFSPEELNIKIQNFFSHNNDFKGITLCISQSGTIAHLGYVLRIKDFDVAKGEWVEYLDGFCINK